MNLHICPKVGARVLSMLSIAFLMFNVSTFAQGATTLPSDFAQPPGLSPCKPIIISKEVICEWHNVDQHAMYVYYLAALPKAGYTLLPGAQEAKTPTYYLAAIGFQKGNAQGALTINGGKDLLVQIVIGP